MALAENIVLSGDTMLLSFALAGDEVRERLLTHVIEADVRWGEPGGGGGTDVAVFDGADGRMSAVLLLDAPLPLDTTRPALLPLAFSWAPSMLSRTDFRLQASGSTKKNLGWTWPNFFRSKMNLDKMQMSRFGKMDVQVRTGFVPVG